MILGSRAKQRELFVLKVLYENEKVFYDSDLYDFYEPEDKEFVPFFEIERQSRESELCDNSQPPGIPFLYTLYSIAKDLAEYGLVRLHSKFNRDRHNKWLACAITEKGRTVYETQTKMGKSR